MFISLVCLFPLSLVCLFPLFVYFPCSLFVYFPCLFISLTSHQPQPHRCSDPHPHPHQIPICHLPHGKSQTPICHMANGDLGSGMCHMATWHMGWLVRELASHMGIWDLAHGTWPPGTWGHGQIKNPATRITELAKSAVLCV